MSEINTIEARKHWDSEIGVPGEIKYLESIQFACISDDNKSISLSTDEEGNGEIILTPESAKWLAKKLILLVKETEKWTEHYPVGHPKEHLNKPIIVPDPLGEF